MRSLNEKLGDHDADRGDHEMRAEEKRAERADGQKREKEKDRRQQRTVTFPLRWIAFAEARVKSHRALVGGIRLRHRALLIAAWSEIVIAVVEMRDIINTTVEIKRIILGAAFIVVARVIARMLRDKTTGFVVTPSTLTRYDEVIQIAGTISLPHQHATAAEPQRESGGGNFGGAGASGNY